MSETKKANPNKSSASETVTITTTTNNPNLEKDLVKNVKARKFFANLTFVSNFFATFVFLFAIIAVFGAGQFVGTNAWLGFWTCNTTSPAFDSSLSGVGITTIVLISIAVVLVLTQAIGNIALKNKIMLTFTIQLSCILLISIITLMVLGLSAKPSVGGKYISWILIVDGTTTHLTTGANVILGQMIFALIYSLTCVIYHLVIQFKKGKAKKEIRNAVEQSQIQE